MSCRLAPRLERKGSDSLQVPEPMQRGPEFCKPQGLYIGRKLYTTTRTSLFCGFQSLHRLDFSNPRGFLAGQSLHSVNQNNIIIFHKSRKNFPQWLTVRKGQQRAIFYNKYQRTNLRKQKNLYLNILHTVIVSLINWLYLISLSFVFSIRKFSNLSKHLRNCNYNQVRHDLPDLRSCMFYFANSSAKQK